MTELQQTDITGNEQPEAMDYMSVQFTLDSWVKQVDEHLSATLQSSHTLGHDGWLEFRVTLGGDESKEVCMLRVDKESKSPHHALLQLTSNEVVDEVRSGLTRLAQPATAE